MAWRVEKLGLRAQPCSSSPPEYGGWLESAASGRDKAMWFELRLRVAEGGASHPNREHEFSQLA